MANFRWHGIGALSLASLLIFFPSALPAQDKPRIRSEPVHFTDGANIKVLDGTIVGAEQVDYLLRLAMGQSLSVILSTHHPGTHFNVLAPGGAEPLFDGSESGVQYEAIIPETGLYRVRVYMSGGDLNPEEQGSYQLEMVLVDGARSSAATDAATDGEHYDATGKVPCAQRIGQPEMQCNFGVIRAGGGSATVLLILPDQSRRIIFFEGGRATGSDASQASSAGRFRVERNEGMNTILVGEERYEIPDSVVSGH